MPVADKIKAPFVSLKKKLFKKKAADGETAETNGDATTATNGEEAPKAEAENGAATEAVATNGNAENGSESQAAATTNGDQPAAAAENGSEPPADAKPE